MGRTTNASPVRRQSTCVRIDRAGSRVKASAPSRARGARAVARTRGVPRLRDGGAEQGSSFPSSVVSPLVVPGDDRSITGNH